MRRRHRDWYRLLAERAADEWVSASHSTWTTRLAREQPNLREALEYCFDEREPETGLLIATSLYPYWLNCGRFSDGRRWLDRALDYPDCSPTIRAHAILLDSVLAGLQDDTQSAGMLLEQASAIADRCASTAALSHYASGFHALYRGEPNQAATQFTNALKMFRDLADVYFEFGTLEGLGLAHLLAGHIDEAVDCLNDALAITSAGELPELQAYPLWTLGIALWQQGNSGEATVALNRAIELSRRTDPLATAWCLQIMAWIAADNNLEQRAATLLGAAEALWHQLGGTTLTFPDMRVFQDHFEHQVRTRLGSKQLAAAREHGAGMSREEAVGFALDESPARRDTPTNELAKLTKREREVAALVAQGLTNKAIAETLVVSQRTAQGHVENILMKLGFTSRTQIAAWIVEQQQ
jgi:DNA-binding CsgD family transcriptional regulator/tetratricopeptide (TPR) repeat protein